jgi:peptidoglycan/LPS O-acetylase OafA/YrhL
VTALAAPPARVSRPGHIGAVDLVRVLTFTAVIVVHVVASVNPSGSIPAGGALMLLHFTREVFFALTAFVLVHRYRDGLRVGPFWRRRFLLVGVPYVAWSVLYTGLALITVPQPPAETLTGALTQLVRNVLTGTAWYHLYFVVVAMQFYLLFPLFLRLLGGSAGHRGRHWWLLAISAVLQVGIDAGVHLAHPSGIAAELVRYSGTFVGSYVFYLVLGGVAALHAEQVQAWVRGHPAIVLVAFALTGAAAEGCYLRSVLGGGSLVSIFPVSIFSVSIFSGPDSPGHPSPLGASAVFQPVMVPWCVAVMVALFALGVTWAARRGAGPGSRAVEIGSDYSFGVFLVHPMVLWALMQGPSEWLSRQVPALGVNVIILAATVVVSLLAVEVLRHSPLSLVFTGKPRSLRPRAVRSSRSESSVPAQPITLGAGRM